MEKRARYKGESQDHQDIDAFLDNRHSISAELALMVRNGMSREQIMFYCKESLATLIDEHVLGIQSNDISGRILPDGRMELQGVDMTASFVNVKNNMQPGSRYWCESEGYLRATEMLRSPDVSGVYLCSPKIEGLDRRMSMILVKDSIPQEDGSYGFRQECITHAQGGESFAHAIEEYHAISSIAGLTRQERPSSADLLKSPVPFAEELLSEVYSQLGINESEREVSRGLQTLFRTTCKEDLEEYAKTMYWAHQYLQRSQRVPEALYQDLTEKRRCLFKAVVSLFPSTVAMSSFHSEKYDPDLCPSLSNQKDYTTEALRQGSMPSVAMGEIRYQMCERCPTCGTFEVKAIVYRGYIQCPHCLDKKPYAC